MHLTLLPLLSLTIGETCTTNQQVVSMVEGMREEMKGLQAEVSELRTALKRSGIPQDPPRIALCASRMVGAPLRSNTPHHLLLLLLQIPIPLSYRVILLTVPP